MVQAGLMGRPRGNGREALVMLRRVDEPGDMGWCIMGGFGVAGEVRLSGACAIFQTSHVCHS